MTSCSRTMVVCGIAGAMLLLSGCGQLKAKVHGERKCLHHKRDVEEPVAAVDVGGQVHEPKTLQIGPDGLTLRRAVMSAGGARELVVSETRGTPESDIVEELNELKSLGREIGKQTLYRDIHDGTEEAEEIIDAPRADAVKAIEEAENRAEAIIDSASRRVGRQLLEELKYNSRDVGYAQESLGLYDQLQPRGLNRQKVQDLRESLDTALEAEVDGIGEMAGSTAEVTMLSHRGTFLVALERSNPENSVTYYFPYELVMTAQAGAIALLANDAVEVVDIHDTSLNPSTRSNPGARPKVLIQGLVTDPGMKDNVRTLGQLNSEVASEFRSQGVWMLQRPVGGIGETVFVFPNSFVGPDGLAQASASRNGDVYTYTALPQVPIVLESLLSRAIGAGVERARCSVLSEKHRARRERRRANYRQFFNVPAKGAAQPQ